MEKERRGRRRPFPYVVGLCIIAVAHFVPMVSAVPTGYLRYKSVQEKIAETDGVLVDDGKRDAALSVAEAHTQHLTGEERTDVVSNQGPGPENQERKEQIKETNGFLQDIYNKDTLVEEVPAAKGGEGEEEEEERPYLFEYSLLFCATSEKDGGCGEIDPHLHKVDEYFKTQDKVASQNGITHLAKELEPDRLLRWEAASAPRRSEPIVANDTTRKLGTPRAPSIIDDEILEDKIPGFFAQAFGVPRDLLFRKKVDKTLNPDNGLLRLPMGVWLYSKKDVVRANEVIRQLEKNSAHMMRMLGFAPPPNDVGPWIWVDTWCPPSTTQAGPFVAVGCEESPDLSYARVARAAAEAAGPEHFDRVVYHSQHVNLEEERQKEYRASLSSSPVSIIPARDQKDN
eukprot:g3181.t1